MKKIDERDTMFARKALRSDSDAYRDYYERHYWQIKGEKCYEVWKRIGTDCGVCMKVCPFSNPMR